MGVVVLVLVEYITTHTTAVAAASCYTAYGQFLKWLFSRVNNVWCGSQSESLVIIGRGFFVRPDIISLLK